MIPSSLLFEERLPALRQMLDHERDPAKLAQLLQAIENERRIATPISMAMHCTAGTGTPFEPYLWLRLLNQRLVDLAARRIRFLIVEVPVRHGKSWLGSKWFPAWYRGHFPEHNIIQTSHNQRLASKFGGEVRDITKRWGPDLFGINLSRSSSAKASWGLAAPHSGLYVATGVGNPPTGEGGHLIDIDDPIRSDKQAYSEVWREATWQWWQFSLRNRLEPDGIVVIIMSRWHMDDLVGRLRERIKQAAEAEAVAKRMIAQQFTAEDVADELAAAGAAVSDEFNDQWEILRLPAIAEDNDPLGRAPGEALCPERYPIRNLKGLRDSPLGVGTIAFEALFQNNPSPAEGGLFKTYNWRYVQAVPAGLEWHRVWDLAATEKSTTNTDPDWTASWLIAKDADGFTYVADVRRFRGEPAEVEDFIRGTAIEDLAKYGCKIVALPKDPGASGKSIVAHYARNVLNDVDVGVFGYDVSGNKVAKAIPMAGQQGSKNLRLLHAYWNDDMVEEARLFPNGAHDDMVDAGAAGHRIVHGLLPLLEADDEGRMTLLV